MRRPRILRATACALALASSPLGAQGQAGVRDTASVIALDTLPVSVLRRVAPLTRAPAAVSVVHGAQIQDGQLTAGLDEALVVVPGVVVNNRYNPSLGSRISIRGFGARAAFGVRGIRLIADGIPLTMPDGQSNLNNLDLGSAARIEVLRGPASALHGNAAGGVIAIQSEAPPPGAFSMQARLLAADLDAGDHDLGNFSKLQLKVGGRGARADYLASVSRQEIDGYRAFSASKQTLVNFQGRYAPDDASRLTLVVNAIDQPVAQSPGALPIDSVRRDRRMAWPNNVRTGSGEATWQAQAGLGYGRASEHGRLDLAVYGLGRGLDNALPFGFIELERRAGGARATYSMDGRWLQRAIGFTVGTDLELLSDDRREFDNAGGRPGTALRRDQIDRVTAVGPFVQGDIDLLPALALTLGARYDAVRFRTTDHFLGDARDDSGERTLTALSPVAGLVFSVRDDTRLYANVATSFQTPTTTELLNAPPAPGQPCCPAGFNEQLEPQRAVSVETGVKGSIGGRLHYDVAAYHMAVRNTLVPFQVSQAEAREFFRNAGQSRHRGIEVGAGLGVQRLTLTGAYSYSHFVFIDDGLESADFDGNRLPGVPPHHLFVNARLDAGVGIALETDFDHTSAYFATDANEDAARNPGATVVDVRALLRTRLGAVGARPFVAVNNITNARYNSSVVVNAAAARYYEPAPGRNIAIGVTIGSGGWR